MRAKLTIDLDALAANYAALKAKGGEAEPAPVVKADGYGLGVGPVSRRLHSEGARRFFVARLSEGERLRAELGGRDAEILILDGVCGEPARLKAARLTPVLSNLAEARAWDGPPAALHVDTGMNRLGVSADEAAVLAREGLAISLVMSHLGAAGEPDDPRNRDQLDRFRPVRALFPNAPASLAASAGIYLGDAYLYEVTRPGISLYGGGPREVPHPDYRAVARLEAPILQIRDIKAGERIGYGSMFQADRAMRIALVAAGYADGIVRRGHRGHYGFVGGKRAPFAVITMDMIAVGVSDIPARIGEPVELLGPNALLDDLAASAETVAHECLVRLGDRAERVYLGGEG